MTAFTCPTRNCRRTDEHDAKGCVPGPDLSTVQPRDTGWTYEIPTADRAYFMPPRFKP